VKSRSIGVVVPNIENPFYLDIYKAVDAVARAEGYETIIANTDYNPRQLVTNIQSMIGRMAGLAAIACEMDAELIDQLDGHEIPVVFYDVETSRSSNTNIRVDCRRGMKKLIDYLYSLGHRRVGFAGGPIHERTNAVLEAVARYPDMAVSTRADVDSLEGGRRAARALLSMGLSVDRGLTAILCANDLMAIGAMREIRERGLRVPEDISVTGFDNVKLAQFCYPSLTTVHIPLDQIGHGICNALILNAVREHEMLIDPELVVRESTGPAPKQ
jgi:LacI family transcriptional regulator